MRILIIGGSGGLGSALAGRLGVQGHEVRIVGRQKRSKGGRVANSRRICLMQGDIRSSSDLARVFGYERWDCVVHLAALLQQACAEDPEEAISINVIGTRNVLKAASNANVKRFVFGSSVAVYGGYHGILREDGPMGADVSIYGLTKLVGERLCEEYEAETHVPTVALRYCGIYGGVRPGSRGMAWVRWQIEQTIRGRSVDIQGASGDEHCQMTHISDAVSATVCIMRHPSLTHRVYNVAGGLDSYITLRDFHAHIKQVVPSAGDISFNGVGKDMSPVSVRRLQELGFQRAYDIAGGVRLLAEARG